MTRILSGLRDTNQPILSYAWKTALLSFVPTYCIALLILLAAIMVLPEEGVTFIEESGPNFGGRNGPTFWTSLRLVTLSPWVETLLMWPILQALKRRISGQTNIAVASALIWALLHSLAAPMWGLYVCWSFFLYSTAFLEWQKKSTAQAIIAVALAHSLHNTVPAILIHF